MNTTTLERPVIGPNEVSDILCQQESGVYNNAVNLGNACYEQVLGELEQAGGEATAELITRGVTDDGTCVVAVAIKQPDGSKKLPGAPYRVFTWQLGTETDTSAPAPEPLQIGLFWNLSKGGVRLHVTDPRADPDEAVIVGNDGETHAKLAQHSDILTITPSQKANGTTENIVRFDNREVWSLEDARLGLDGRATLSQRTGQFLGLAERADKAVTALLHANSIKSVPELEAKLRMSLGLLANNLSNVAGKRMKAALEPLHDAVGKFDHARELLYASADEIGTYVRNNGPDAQDYDTGLGRIDDRQRAAAVAFAIHGAPDSTGIFRPGPLHKLIELEQAALDSADTSESLAEEKQRLLAVIEQTAKAALLAYSEDPLSAWKDYVPAPPPKPNTHPPEAVSVPDADLPRPYAGIAEPIRDILKEVFGPVDA